MDYPNSCARLRERVEHLKEVRDMIQEGGATVTLTLSSRSGQRKRARVTLGPQAARHGIGEAFQRAIEFELARLSRQKELGPRGQGVPARVTTEPSRAATGQSIRTGVVRQLREDLA